MPKSSHYIRFKSEKAKSINLAGTFNNWCRNNTDETDFSIGKMEKHGKNKWIFPVKGIHKGIHQYKFIIDGEWEKGSNRIFQINESGTFVDLSGGIDEVLLEKTDCILITFSDKFFPDVDPGNISFVLKPSGTVLSVSKKEGISSNTDAWILKCCDINIRMPLSIELTGLSEHTVSRNISLDGIFRNSFITNKELGVFSTSVGTIFRIFAPRAIKVTLLIFDDSEYQKTLVEKDLLVDSDGLWETSLPDKYWGKYYGYRVSTTESGDKILSDPYCRASVFHNGLSVLIEPDSISFPFKGWNDKNFVIPKRNDLIIWECSLRDLTSHVSSGVEKELRSKYIGLCETEGTLKGIGHAKDLGVNAVELMPVFEYDDDPPGTYHWGYMPSLFFAPEAFYATNPYGKQYYEFKELINRLHMNNLAVILDVVFNHTGAPHALMSIDKQYFYRHDHDMKLLNFSGCGNDLKTELPMTRKLIIDSLKYWVKEFHIDGFRFDLAELIDLETLNQIEKEITALKSDVILIAEPWSFRGTIKGKLKGTSWTNWNDDFRNSVKSAALGTTTIKDLETVLKGSVDLWTDSPLETVNYVESHDNYTLTDHLCQASDHNGSDPSPLDIKRNLFCAAALLLSPGIPMIAQGQEMLRSKFGNHNSYNAGDGINGINYELKNRFPHVYSKYKSLIEFRKSDSGAILRNLSGKECKTVQTFYSEEGNAIAFHWEKTPYKQLLVFFNPDNFKTAHFKIKCRHTKFKRILSTETTEALNNEQHNQNDQKHHNFSIPSLSVEVWTA
ncbi:MAG: hypothetical protein HQM10_25345 [Candidatus Riflebacteria bacterium]|nr:hypothetical protein [Candidatus Riflebacteria bacterium]